MTTEAMGEIARLPGELGPAEGDVVSGDGVR